MTEPKKPLDLWIIALGDFFPPGVMETKEAAEMCVELTKSSNDPHIIHVREVIPDEPSEIIELIHQRSIAFDEAAKYKKLAEELAEALDEINSRDVHCESDDPIRRCGNISKKALASYRKALRGYK